MNEIKINVADQISKFELSATSFLAIVKDAVSPDIKAQNCNIKDVAYITKSDTGGHGMSAYATRYCDGISVKYGLKLELANIAEKSEMTGEIVLNSKQLLEVFKKLILTKIPALQGKKAEIDFEIQNTADDRFGGYTYEVTKVTIRFS